MNARKEKGGDGVKRTHFNRIKRLFVEKRPVQGGEHEEGRDFGVSFLRKK